MGLTQACVAHTWQTMIIRRMEPTIFKQAQRTLPSFHQPWGLRPLCSGYAPSQRRTCPTAKCNSALYDTPKADRTDSYLVDFFRLVIVVFVASVSLRWRRAEVRLVRCEPATAQVMGNEFALAPELHVGHELVPRTLRKVKLDLWVSFWLTI